MREVAKKDKALLLRWRNDPDTVSNSRSGERISPGEHCEWFEMVISSSQISVFVAETKLKSTTRPIGMCRFDPRLNGEFAVSIVLAPEFRGKGLASSVLRMGIEELNAIKGMVTMLSAVVHQANLPSLRVFEALGFRRVETVGPWVDLQKRA